MQAKIFTVVFLLLSLLAGSPAMALEEPEYGVLLEAGDIEFRRYNPYIVAEVTVDGPNPDRAAFSILAGYIFGDNDADVKMSMTAPVETRGNDYAFVMERKYSMETLPKPIDQRIRLRDKEERVVAVLPFSGRWSQQNVEKHEQRLLSALAEMGVDVIGEPELARYNSPFTPWFMRRNEIIVEIDYSQG